MHIHMYPNVKIYVSYMSVYIYTHIHTLLTSVQNDKVW